MFNRVVNKSLHACQTLTLNALVLDLTAEYLPQVQLIHLARCNKRYEAVQWPR